MNVRTKKILVGVGGLICGVVVMLWYTALVEAPRGLLTIAFLNVGQGDAIFIESPTGHQVLVDAGEGSVVLEQLRTVMPWHDRSIDMIIATNPDRDHIGGFIPVLTRYKIGVIVQPDTPNDTVVYRSLQKSVDNENAQEISARRGQTFDLGGGTYLTILFPDRSLPKADSNTGSIIARLVYGSISVMLTGDAPNKTLEYVADLDKDAIRSTILKMGHHGSRTSDSERFLQTVKPQYAIISAGKNNRYKHPHPETIHVLQKNNVPILGTYEWGTIVFKSDGVSLWRE